MARLRIRIELSRGGVGVPLHKVASVIAESQKFLHLLGDDIHIEKHKGEWLGFDFDRESLNFTAEYVGPVTQTQVDAFNAAFGGTTSLNRETISQFIRIAEAIGEDEVIGFGLYQAEDIAEPTEWRCLSRRDALRIADEVQMLTGPGEESHLPAVRDPAMGARMFGDRRDRELTHNRLIDYVREVESGLSHRIQNVEHQVERHSDMITEIRTQSTVTETSFRNLLTTFETFCDQATRRIEQFAPAQLAAPAAPPAPAQAKEPETPEAPVFTEPEPARRRWMGPLAGGVIAVVVIAVAMFWPVETGGANRQKTTPVVAETPATPAAAPEPSPEAPAPQGPAEVTLEASAPTWVSIRDVEGKPLMARLLVPGEPRNVTLQNGAVLRTGNAGGLNIVADGKSLGSLGASGQIREIEFKDGRFLVSTPK